MRNEADYVDNLPWTDVAATVVAALASADRVFQSLVPPKSS
jgi:hypothetical protein